MLDKIAPVLGILGFVLAIASLAWHVYTHYDNRKERLRATFTLDGDMLSAGMWNAGRVAVYLSFVNVEWRDTEGEVDGMTLKSGAPENEPLRVGETREFEGYALEPRLLGAVVHRPKTIRVTVHSPHGQIAQFRGRTLRAILRELREHASAPSPSE